MLVKCGECGQPVSTNAVACPHCGNEPLGECVRCARNDGQDIKNYLNGFTCHTKRNCCPGFTEGFFAMNPERLKKSEELWEGLDPNKTTYEID